MNEDLFEGLHHISLITSSQRTLRLYEIMGFKKTLSIQNAYNKVVIMEGHGLTLEFLIDRHAPKKDRNLDTLGMRCFSLQMSDFKKVFRRIPCGGMFRDWKGQRYCYIRALDGQTIEMHE